MIGDWVTILRFRENGSDRNVRINGIGRDCILAPGMFQDNTGCDPYDYKQLAPIPLTEEILEKNGWKCTDKQIWDSDYYINAVFEYDEITHSHLALQQFDEFGTFAFGVNSCLWEGFSICYVHELQRALRLCGLNDLEDSIIL